MPWNKIGLVLMLLALFLAVGAFGANVVTALFVVGLILYMIY